MQPNGCILLQNSLYSHYMQNTITRELTINASKEKIYKALTDPTQLVQWFPNTIEGTLNVGDRPILGFGEHGKNQIYVEAAQPFEYFSYRWIPGSNHFIGDVLTKPNTLVEFRLQESNGVTTVTMTESGFNSLPTDVADKDFKQNTEGWNYMLGRLENLMNQS
jgi:uncharacterized protein YndB with AHSA1/START domain